MGKIEHFMFSSSDEISRVHAVRWIPDGEIRAILQITHGMVEYIERYDEFARYLNKYGILVTGNDHLGHGKTAANKDGYGFFAEKDGNRCLIRDLHRLHRLTAEKYPDVPYFLLGHSMGSFLARQYLCCYGTELDGAIIMGTAFHSRTEAKFGMLLTTLLAKKKGWGYRSSLVEHLATGSGNKHFAPNRTSADWLTRDEQIVDKYLSEEECTFTFTLNGYYNLFLSLFKLTFEEYLTKMPRDLPVFFVAGMEDPVGNYGKGVKKVADGFLALGMRNVECKLYPEDRHEILNELDRENIYADIRHWMEKVLEEKQ